VLMQLDRPAYAIDFETTGVHAKVDRIIQIGIIQYLPNGDKIPWKTYVNPQMPIPIEASDASHHITDDMVKDAPIFAEFGPALYRKLHMSDTVGFNHSRFDIGFLVEEFRRLHLVYVPGRKIDVFRLLKKVKPMTLSAAVKEILGKDMGDSAHDALVDIEWTMELLDGLLEQNPDLPRDAKSLHNMLFETVKPGNLDPDEKIAWRNGVACMNFGKHAGTPLKSVPRQYLHWAINDGDFEEPTKEIMRDALSGRYPTKKPLDLG